MIASGSLGLRDRLRDEAQRPNGFIAMPLRPDEDEARSAAETRALNLVMDCADPDNTTVGELAQQLNRQLRITDNRTSVERRSDDTEEPYEEDTEWVALWWPGWQ